MSVRLAGAVGRGRPGGYQPGFVGEHDGLDAVTQAELGQDPADMNLHRALGQEQAGRSKLYAASGAATSKITIIAIGRSLPPFTGVRPAARRAPLLVSTTKRTSRDVARTGCPRLAVTCVPAVSQMTWPAHSQPSFQAA